MTQTCIRGREAAGSCRAMFQKGSNSEERAPKRLRRVSFESFQITEPHKYEVKLPKTRKIII